ncbi:hypothetical protein QJQ45_014453 [Haematococcus lacustris]|nr:hypothetical protein QJQ45_014453 [Haematococcus lacustris]
MIASWYKRILLRRRQQELTQLMMKLRRVMKPLLVAKKEQIRVKCAERILTFLEVADASGGYSVSTAVMRYKEKLIRLQRIWRMMTQVVRATQRIILLNYFTRFERSVIRRNRKEQHHQLDQVRGRPRGQSSGPRRSSLAVGEFASYSGHGRTSRDTSPSGFDLGASSDLGTLSDSLRGSAHLPGSRGPHTPSHYAGGFNASMDSGAAVIVKAGANYSPHGPSLHAPGGALTSALKGASHGRKGAEVMDPLLEAELAQHREPLPLDVKHEVRGGIELVQRALLECRRKFYAQLSTYRTNMELYDAQKPIEELRLRLLRDAGLDPVSHLAKPRKPAMLVLLPKPALKRMLRDGIHLLEEKRLAAQVARRAAVDALWLEKQAQKQGGAACAGTLPAAAGTGAQGQGQGPKGPLALDVVLGALEGVGPDLASGSPLAPLALGPTTHLLPHAYTQGGSAV